MFYRFLFLVCMVVYVGIGVEGVEPYELFIIGYNSKCVWGMSLEAKIFTRLHTNALATTRLEDYL